MLRIDGFLFSGLEVGKKLGLHPLSGRYIYMYLYVYQTYIKNVTRLHAIDNILYILYIYLEEVPCFLG